MDDYNFCCTNSYYLVQTNLPEAGKKIGKIIGEYNKAKADSVQESNQGLYCNRIQTDVDLSVEWTCSNRTTEAGIYGKIT